MVKVMASTAPQRPTLVEVCAGSLADALAAAKAGADRIELCSATEVGGLTPSIGLLELVLERVKLPVMVMIRPRAGGFCYSEEEIHTALRDAERALSVGAHGIVFGFLTRDARIDVAHGKAFCEIAGARQTVFHRAFDFVEDTLVAADQLAEIGVTRLLTSGRQPSALAGAALIRQLVDRVNGALKVMPGGGINSQNVDEILRITGCHQVHVGAATRGQDGSLAANAALELVAPEYLERGAFRKVDGTRVSEIVRRVKA
jgi:copper homeostasis protein